MFAKKTVTSVFSPHEAHLHHRNRPNGCCGGFYHSADTGLQAWTHNACPDLRQVAMFAAGCRGEGGRLLWSISMETEECQN